ncbi:hypothetical protein ASE01_06405 [Nocardioides sp. Root190]|uniref:hypothetical protein n=1 Tax=Nocardioides sp. Root190 TaxID=1736488 RepID=UPI0006F701F7|nr:hypothetical protein [Nocardioides sp. Root190]KRB77821.1 hypothetical protein ASE01_06405 [Nocardioides sp. Root190]
MASDLIGTPADLLAVGLRTRAGTVAQLAALAVRDEDEVRRDLRTLVAEGYVAVDGEHVRYADPVDVVAATVRRRAAALEADLSQGLADLTRAVGALPGLTGEWASEGLRAGRAEVFHGPEAVVDLWHARNAREPSMRTDVVLPDASRLYVADPAMQEVWHDASRGEGRHARVIASIADATHPAAQDRVAEELAGGVQIRLLDAPPSWFWVTDETTVALPLVWGEHWPTSVLAIRDRAVAGMAGWLFERMWERAVPVRTEAAAWHPLLDLMSAGATLEAASRALGISERTGRRRISEAMSHFGAGTMLELGVAWASGRPR